MFLHGISHVLEDRDQNLLVTPVKLLLMVPTARKAEEGSGQPQPVRAGRGKPAGEALSRRWKGRISALKDSPSEGKDPPGIWIAQQKG